MRDPIDLKQQFIELRAKGLSFDKIAKQLKKSKVTLLDWARELKDEVAQAKAIELEAVIEKYYLHTQARLQMFGELLQKIREEAKTRDLSQVPTEKLLELMLKFNSQVKEELVEPQFMSSQEVEEAKLNRELLDKLTAIGPELKLKTA